MRRRGSGFRLTQLLRVLTAVALSAAALSLSAQPSAKPTGIAVSPGNVTVDISSGSAGGAIRVFNLNSDPMTVNANVSHFDLDAGNKVRAIPPTPQSLDQWLLINPLRFTIPPGGSQVVRFAVRPRARPDPGEHRAMVYFSPQLESDPEATISVAVRMGVAIYGVAQPVRRLGSVQQMQVSATTAGVDLALTVVSTGNALVRLNGHYGIWPESNYPGDSAASRSLARLERDAVPEAALAAGRLPTTPVLAGTERVLVQSVPVDLESGRRYRIAIQGELQDTPLTASVTFIAE